MKHILIIGDSFSCTHESHGENIGWPELLRRNFKITNLSQAGVSEYKIYKQLISIDLNQFDSIIICHTSFFRIPIKENTFYQNSKLHKSSDLIFTDVESKKNISKKMKTAFNFFKYFFWKEYFLFTNGLIFEQIYEKTKDCIHITFFDDFYDARVTNFHNIFLNHRGDVNHLDKNGNTKIFSYLKKELNENI